LAPIDGNALGSAELIQALGEAPHKQRPLVQDDCDDVLVGVAGQQAEVGGREIRGQFGVCSRTDLRFDPAFDRLHGRLIDEVGYHARDYFLTQWERFKHVPGGILAHSTHVKGTGTFDSASGVETPRIQVTLATAIPEERCRRVNLGYADYRTIDPQEWGDREAEGVLLVPHAGEMLYRGEALFRVKESA
jgi:hypothetical protein